LDSFETVALYHSSRGMEILKKSLKPEYITNAAKALLNCKKETVFIATGFYVNGSAETDGPLGAFCLAKTLQNLGYFPIILTDSFCSGIFEEENISVIYAQTDSSKDDFIKLLKELKPVALISVERCGKNSNNDYANMRNISIKKYTAPIDSIFEEARKAGILTIGIGDGGNEIGMGLVKDEISQKLSLVPCVVPTEHLIVATTSNWGAYGLSAALLKYSDKEKGMPTSEEIGNFLAKIVSKGFVDGVSGKSCFKVDGFDGQVEMDIADKMQKILSD